MRNPFSQLLQKSQKEETVVKAAKIKSVQEDSSPTPSNLNMDDLIKMKEATKLIKASPPTVRKYARLGYYKEYHFGEKLVFYNRTEMLDFIINKGAINKP
jgi:hypothetical protein